MPGEKIVDIAYNTGAVFSGVGIDAAFLATCTHIAGILGIDIFACNIAVAVKDINGGNHIIFGFPRGSVFRFGSGYLRPAGCCGIGICGACAGNEAAVFNAVLGHLGHTVSGVAIGRFIDRISGSVLQEDCCWFIFAACKFRFLSVGISHGRQSTIGIGVLNAGTVRSLDQGKISGCIVGECEFPSCAIGYRSNSSVSIGDLHHILMFVRNGDEPAGIVKQIGITAGLQGFRARIVQHFAALNILIKIAAL